MKSVRMAVDEGASAEEGTVRKMENVAGELMKLSTKDVADLRRLARIEDELELSSDMARMVTRTTTGASGRGVTPMVVGQRRGHQAF